MSKKRKVIAVQECSVGNDCVGEMWLETGLFDTDTPVGDILSWGQGLRHSGGRLILTVPKRGSEVTDES